MYKPIKPKAPDLCIMHYEDFGEHMKRLIKQHVESVPRIIETRQKLQGKIEEGMETTWRFVCL